MNSAFDALARNYDQWYDTPEGQVILQAEADCLRLLGGPCLGAWVEVGVGTGRFASALGIATGVDPSPRMLAIAASRGIQVCQGRAEHLPFPDASLDGILMALTLCFLPDPLQALRECQRTLQPTGSLLLGIIPLDSPWGSTYLRKAAEEHPVYSLAHFRTVPETVALAHVAGFRLAAAASTLFWRPAEKPPPQVRIEAGAVPAAGFVGLLLSGAATHQTTQDLRGG